MISHKLSIRTIICLLVGWGILQVGYYFHRHFINRERLGSLRGRNIFYALLLRKSQNSINGYGGFSIPVISLSKNSEII